MTKNFSRYIEIPRRTSWLDSNTSTRCSCSIDGYLSCTPVHSKCARPCLVHRRDPYSISYYFPSGSSWITTSKEQCRRCRCDQGERQCLNCHPILTIKIDTRLTSLRDDSRLQPSTLSRQRQIRPCLLELESNSHRLIYPGQQTWWQEKCYFCSMYQGRLIRC